MTSRFKPCLRLKATSSSYRGICGSMSRTGSVAGDVPGNGGRRCAVARPALLAPSSGKKAVVIRSEWTCSTCLITGTAPNEFEGASPYAHHDQVVIARGSQDKPRGDVCMKCMITWGTGGWREEFNDDIDKFIIEKDKDDTINDAWMASLSLWLESHNSGKRVRAIKSERYAKRTGNCESVFNKVKMLRENRKKVVKTSGRFLKAKTSMKFCTPEAYHSRFNRTLESDGHAASWHNLKGKRMFGVIINMTPEGEMDLEDEHIDGVEHEEEVESGDDQIREGQSLAKFNFIAGGLDNTIAAAIRVTMGGALGGGGAGLSADNDEEASSSDDDIFVTGCVPLGGAVLHAATPKHVPLAPSSGPRKVVPPAAPQRKGGLGSSAVQPGAAAAAQVAKKPAPPSASHANSKPECEASMVDELNVAKFDDLVGAIVAALNGLAVEALAQPCKSLAEKEAAKAVYKDIHKQLGVPCTKLSQAENQLKRRKFPSEAAIAAVVDFKKGTSNVQKLLNIFLGTKACCESTLAGIMSTKVAEHWDPPIAVLCEIIHHTVIDKVRFSSVRRISVGKVRGWLIGRDIAHTRCT